MPIRTGLISLVETHPKYRSRFSVWLVGPLPLYTMNPLHASWCLAARKEHREVVLGTRDTQYGEEIVTLAYAGEGEAA